MHGWSRRCHRQRRAAAPRRCVPESSFAGGHGVRTSKCRPSLAMRSVLRSRRVLRIWFGSTWSKKVAQFQACLVELRFTVTGRAAHQSRNLLVLVALDIVQGKDGSVSGGQLLDAPVED